MVVETEAAFRHQTISHFIHTFIRNYNRESAADRTMRSQYVPKNIKIQLLAAVRQCGGNESNNSSVKISSIANMGLFIDNSCNEIVYYHSITSSVLQWTVSLYVHDSHVKNIIKTVLEDMGRIGDEDIQFILEKYKNREEQRMAGYALDDSPTGVDKLLSFLKPKKFQPTTSYFSYYTQSIMLKLAKSLLRNSAIFLNGNVFNIGPDPDATSRSPSGGLDADEESRYLYADYKAHRQRLATMAESESLEKMENVLKRGMINERGVAMKEPPEEIRTAFDGPGYSDDEDDECYGDTRGGRAPSGSTLEDLEVEAIFRSSGDTDFDSDRDETPDRTVSLWTDETAGRNADALTPPLPAPTDADYYTNAFLNNGTLDSEARLLPSSTKQQELGTKAPPLPPHCSKRLAAEKTTTKITFDENLQNFLKQEQTYSVTSSFDGTTTLEKTVLKVEACNRSKQDETGAETTLQPPLAVTAGVVCRPLPALPNVRRALSIKEFEC